LVIGEQKPRKRVGAIQKVFLSRKRSLQITKKSCE
jgi:hypothetical protein